MRPGEVNVGDRVRIREWDDMLREWLAQHAVPDADTCDLCMYDSTIRIQIDGLEIGKFTRPYGGIATVTSKIRNLANKWRFCIDNDYGFIYSASMFASVIDDEIDICSDEMDLAQLFGG